MCSPGLDVLYDQFLLHYAEFKKEINTILLMGHPKFRYTNLLKDDSNGVISLVYLSVHTKLIAKIIINYGDGRENIPTISVFCEDSNVQLQLESTTSYNGIRDTLTELKHQQSLEKVYNKLAFDLGR